MPLQIPEDPNPQAIKLFRILKILAVFQLGFGIFTLFVDISSGFYMLIGSLLLYMIPCGRNWCTCVMYIILCLMDSIFIAYTLGNYFSVNRHIESQYGIFITVCLLKFPFYLISNYYSFLAYRELKALTLELSGNFQEPWEQQSRPPPAVFTGPGYVI